MLEWQKRVVEENAELNRKIDALALFLDSPASQSLTTHDRDLLVVQRAAMQHYKDILAQRIICFGDEPMRAVARDDDR